jgi:hypothetical protein
MALEQQMMQQQAPAEQQAGPPSLQPLTDEEEMDLKIAVLMTEHMLQEGGFDVIQKAVDSSKDPGQVIGQFLMQLGQQLHESMPDDMKLSPKMMLVKNGWLEQVSDYIQEEDGVKKDIMDKAEIYVASTASQMAKAKQQQSGGTIDGIAAPPAPGPGAPPMPQEGGM